MYDTILVPTDGSEGVDESVDHALAIAGERDATIHALYVVDRRPYLAAEGEEKEDVLESLKEEGARAVEAVESRVREAGVSVVSTVREGIPYRDIIDYAAAEGVDLIVMGTHGRTGRDRLANLGSVTERVVENAERPVLVVHIGESSSE